MKVVLLDRDGTIIRDPEDERVDKEAKIELFPDTIEALRLLADNDFSIIIITNQAGIAEGLLSEDDFFRINTKVIEMFAPTGIKILKTYFCPHQKKDECDCRKPSPKMLLEAVKEFNLNAADLYMVGDRESDIDAGIAAGTKTILVKTANEEIIAEQATYTANTFLEAAKYILSN
jgi:D-glycero-D-manno-heptose 1,7-bisphosphate phosphatase